MITSQYRIDFWIGKIATFIGVLAITVFVFYLWYRASEKLGEMDYQHLWFWIGITAFSYLSFSLYRFFFDELKTVIVSEQGITFRYMFSEAEKIGFEEIKKLDFYPVYTVRRRTSGISHYALLITLHDGNTFKFDGYQYRNFSAVKSMIYQYVYHEN